MKISPQPAEIQAEWSLWQLSLLKSQSYPYSWLVFFYTMILKRCYSLSFGTFLVLWTLELDERTTLVLEKLSQTSFSLYLHNQWTDFHKLSCAGTPQMRAICTYVGCTKATINNWDIRPSVAVKALSANISWMAEQIRTIKLALESAHQSVYNDIWCVSKQ